MSDEAIIDDGAENGDSTANVIKDGKDRSKKKRSSSKAAAARGAGKGKRQKTKAERLSDVPLSEAHHQLLNLFSAVDHAYCFLVNNSILPRVASLQSLVWRLFPGRFGDETSFLPRLRELAGVAPSVMVLEEPADGGRGGVEDEFQAAEPPSESRRLELRFPQKNTSGTGKAKVSKRLQLMRQAMLEHADGSSRQAARGASSSNESCDAGGGVDTSPAPAAKRGGRAATSGAESSLGRRRGSDVPGSGREGSALDMGGASAGEGVATARESAGDEQACVRAKGKGKGKGKGRGSDKDRSSTEDPAAGGVNEAAAARAGVPTGGRVKRGPATGTALSLLGPLSASPAYVVVRQGGGQQDRDGKNSGAGGIRAEAGVGAGGIRRDGEEKEEEGQKEDETSKAAPGAQDGGAASSLRFDPQLTLDYLKSLPIYEGQAVYSETLPGRDGEFADTLVPLHPEVWAALAASKGVTRLFKHQALAIDAAAAGQHVALSTATSSGKSVVFNVSVIEALVGPRPNAVALYLFPTKALAQDQLRSLKELVEASAYLRERVRPMTLDGDTPFGERGVVSEEANIILTNPDMLHASVLPGHKRFRRVLTNLSHVVIDEAHVYRGAFGAHVSMVLRRLLRLWSVNAQPGPPPQFICCSATMSSAPSHFASLLPLEECLGGRERLYYGSADTAPTGRKTFVLWRPPIVADWFTEPLPTSAAAKNIKIPTGDGDREGGTTAGVEGGDGETKRGPGSARSRRGGRGRGSRGRGGRGGGTGRAQSSASRGSLSLGDMETWRKGPTDNFYNKEYRKLMGAELPRPSGTASPPSSSCSSSVGKTLAVGSSGAATSTSPSPSPKQAMDVAGTPVGDSTVDGDGHSTSVAAAATPSSSSLSPAARTPEQSATRNSTAGKGAAPAEGVAAEPAPSSTTEGDSDALVAKGGGGRGFSREAAALLEAGIVGAATALTYADGSKTAGNGSSTDSGEPNGNTSDEAAASARAAKEGAVVAGFGGSGKGKGKGKGEGEGGGNGEGEDGDEWEDCRRRSPICETAEILAALVKQRVKTLAFCRTRKLTELTLRYGHQDLEKTAPHMVSLVQGYRGGYTKGERRKIEGSLFANKLLGVTATCALELGVDIGELDVTLHLGFPGSVSSLRQQAGRAGRGGTDSLAIMVLFQDPISQFFVRNPAELLHKEPEAAVLDSNNDLVLRAHLLCAAAECPLGIPTMGGVTDAALFGGEERLAEVIDTMTGGDFPRLVRVTGNLGWKANPGLNPPPCRRVGLRMIDPVSFSVVDDLKGGEAFDSVEYSRAFFALFQGAIYLHQARQYLVTRLDLGAHVAHTIPVKRGQARPHKQMGTGRTLERGECTLPPLQYATRAFWLDVGVTAKSRVQEEGLDFEGGVHAVGHALLAVVPLFLLCDAADVDCEHARPHHNRPQPHRILVYDKRPGGVGVSDAMFGCHRAVLSKALELVEGCPCPDGCLACVHDHACMGYNAIIDKRAASVILKSLIHDMMTGEADGETPVVDLVAPHAAAAAAARKSSHARKGQEREEGKANKHTHTPPSRRWELRRRRGGQPEDGSGGGDAPAGHAVGGFFLGQGENLRGDSEDGDDVVGLGANGGSGGGGGSTASDGRAGQKGGLHTGGGCCGSGKSGAVGTGEDVEEEPEAAPITSPRKKQRLRNLRLAKGMDRAREKDIAVVGCWIPSVP
eukprot:g6448.t1